MASQVFIYRRWSTQEKVYVDSQGQAVQVSESRPQLYESALHPLTSCPPKDGSSPFLALPPELRLEIYSHLVSIIPAQSSKVSWIGHEVNDGQRRRYAYLWRSPGRINQPEAASIDVLTLLQVCRLVRHELLNVAFRDTVFVLEASLYHRTVAGLWTLPCIKTLPVHWVQRLLIITVLDVESTRRRMANLLPLQQMTSLREIRVVAAVTTPRGVWLDRLLSSPMTNEAERTLAPISAVVECIPESTKVIVDFNSAVEDELRSHLGGSIDYLFNDGVPKEAAEAMRCALPFLQRRQGVLSGDSFDHSQCLPSKCGSGDIGCVNSRCMPNL